MQDFSDQREGGAGAPLENFFEDSASPRTLIKEVLKRFEDANLSSEVARDRIACEITEILDG